MWGKILPKKWASQRQLSSCFGIGTSPLPVAFHSPRTSIGISSPSQPSSSGTKPKHKDTHIRLPLWIRILSFIDESKLSSKDYWEKPPKGYGCQFTPFCLFVYFILLV